MNIGRSLNKTAGKELTHRIYKFNSQAELNTEIDIYKKHFRNSVEIQSSGQIDGGTLTMLKNMDNENVIHDLDIKFNDFFLLTRENINTKLDDEKRMVRKLSKAPITTPSSNDVLIKKTKKYSAEERLALLWSDTAENVAKILGVQPHSIYTQRSKYCQENPDFVKPECCYTKTRKIKGSKSKSSKKRYSDKDILELFWNNSASNLAPILNISSKRINEVRRKYCDKNPEFVIPKSAAFKYKGKNAVKNTSYHYSTKDKIVLWSADGDTVAGILGKTKSAIWQARRKYCEKNPDFVVPLISKFVVPSSLFNKTEVATIKEVVTENIPEIIEKVSNNTTPVTNENVSSVDEKPVEETMEQIAYLLNSLKDKPKKIKIGAIELEF